MPEPSTDRGRDAKARIISASAALMYQRGVATTSLKDILTATGTGKSQLYHYFTSKEDLVGAVLRHQVRRILDEQKGYPLDTWAGISAWFDSLIDAHETQRNFHGCPLGSIASEVLEQGESLRRQAIDTLAQWEASLSRELQTMQTRGLLRDDADPQTLAETTIAVLQGGYFLSATKRHARPMRNALNAALAHLQSFAPIHVDEGSEDAGNGHS